jgi:hypothetical protein
MSIDALSGAIHFSSRIWPKSVNAVIEKAVWQASASRSSPAGREAIPSRQDQPQDYHAEAATPQACDSYPGERAK